MHRDAPSPIAGGLRAALLLLACVAAGCGDTDARPAVWSYVSPVILEPNCATASCHGPAASVAGLDFSDPDSGYASLTRLYVLVVDPTGQGGPGCGTADGVVVCEHKARPLVIPYDPNESRLVNMLRARNAPRMPPDRPLAESDIRLIERWILDGAKKGDGAGGAAGGDGSAANPDGGVEAGTPDGPKADAGAEVGGDAKSDAAGAGG